MKKSNIKNLEQQKRFLKFYCGETLKAKKELELDRIKMNRLKHRIFCEFKYVLNKH